MLTSSSSSWCRQLSIICGIVVLWIGVFCYRFCSGQFCIQLEKTKAWKSDENYACIMITGDILRCSCESGVWGLDLRFQVKGPKATIVTSVRVVHRNVWFIRNCLKRYKSEQRKRNFSQSFNKSQWNLDCHNFLCWHLTKYIALDLNMITYLNST